MLEAGIKGKIECTVIKENTAEVMKSGTLPVFATPSMIALIEETAWKSIADELEEGCVTVGTALNVAHLSATPLGMKVWAETELVSVEGRKLVFEVQVFDEAGLIGKGTHERFIVFGEKFLAKTQQKGK